VLKKEQHRKKYQHQTTTTGRTEREPKKDQPEESNSPALPIRARLPVPERMTNQHHKVMDRKKVYESNAAATKHESDGLNPLVGNYQKKKEKKRRQHQRKAKGGLSPPEPHKNAGT